MKTGTKTKPAVAALAGLALLLAASGANAQTIIYHVYNPASTGGSKVDQYKVNPHSAAQGMYQGTDAEIWRQLFQSGNVIGWGTTLTRSRGDAFEDWAYNFVDPDNSSRNYYQDFHSTNSSAYVSRSSYPLVLKNTGPHAGESVLGNNSIVAMGDDSYIFYDGDGTLSRYNYVGGALMKDYAWTEFGGGAYGGVSLEDKLFNLIGYEEGYLFFLDGDRTIVGYTLEGAYAGTYDINLGGALAGYTLGDIIDGKADGYSYLGWDVGPVIINVGGMAPPVPEPAFAALFAGTAAALSVFAARRRKIRR